MKNVYGWTEQQISFLKEINEKSDKFLEKQIIRSSAISRFECHVELPNVPEEHSLLYIIPTILNRSTHALEIGVDKGIGTLLTCNGINDIEEKQIREKSFYDSIDFNSKDVAYTNGRLNKQKCLSHIRNHFWKKTSYTVLTRLARSGKNYNFFFIDGSHDYKDVKCDISLCKELMSPGRNFMLLHDTNAWPGAQSSHGPMKALEEVDDYTMKMDFHFRHGMTVLVYDV